MTPTVTYTSHKTTPYKVKLQPIVVKCKDGFSLLSEDSLNGFYYTIMDAGTVVGVSTLVAQWMVLLHMSF